MVYLLVIAFAVLRVWMGVSEESLANLMPLSALAFSSAALLNSKSSRFFVPAILLLSDVALNSMLGYSIFSSWTLIALACYFAFAYFGSTLQLNRSAISVLGGTFTCSVAFYLISNTLAFFSSPLYAKTLSGWVQALTVGLPGYPPTWMFFRNSLIGDMSYAVLLIVALNAVALFGHTVRVPLIKASR